MTFLEAKRDSRLRERELALKGKEPDLQLNIQGSSYASDIVSTQTCVLYTGLYLELSFSENGGVHDRLHVCPLCGIIYFPWHRHQIEGTKCI